MSELEQIRAHVSKLRDELSKVSQQRDALLSAMRRAVVAGAHPSLQAKEDCYNILDQALLAHGTKGGAA